MLIKQIPSIDKLSNFSISHRWEEVEAGFEP